MSKQMVSHFFIIQMFRLQHSPLSGDSVSTAAGTAISLTRFHIYYFHCTLLARPAGSSVLGEHFLDPTNIRGQTDITTTETKVTFTESTKQRNAFLLSCLERRFNRNWEKESQKEGKSNIFCTKLMQSLDAEGYDLWL